MPLPFSKPVTEVVRVIAGVEVAVATVPAKPFAVTTETEVTVPAPAGVAHVPSPRQNVDEEALVPPLRFATGRLPVTPVERGSPVQLVSVPLVGVPRIGVTNVGVLANTRAPEPVSSLITPLSCKDVVEANCARLPDVRASPPPGRLCHVAVVELVAMRAWPVVGAVAAEVLTVVVAFLRPLAAPAVKPAAVPVMFVPTNADGVPRSGVMSTGDDANTSAPLPVSSEMTPLSCSDVVLAN